MWHWVPTPGAQFLFQPATAVFTGCVLLLAVGLGPRSPDCRGLETLPGPLPQHRTAAAHGCGHHWPIRTNSPSATAYRCAYPIHATAGQTYDKHGDSRTRNAW